MKPPIATDEPPEPNCCFADSRRLTGHNRFFAGPGAVLEPLGPGANDENAHERWRVSVTALRRALGWNDAPAIVSRHHGGTLLAMSAPADALFTATEINEWAWERASGIFSPGAAVNGVPPFDQMHALGDDFNSVVAAFTAKCTQEINPALQAMRRGAHERQIPIFIDDSEVSVGAGAGSRTWPLGALPEPAQIPWQDLHGIPIALVTGSNGKTTTVRLLTSIIGASATKFHGHVGYASTEGVMIGGIASGDGDFSGPAGARVVLRDARVTVAVLETARGGILRRGLAVERADVAIITNISADHFGEYGIDSLDDLAEVKLAVAHALGTEGTLVLNADDQVLLARAAYQNCHVALFARDDAHPALVLHRQTGGATCGLVDDQLWLTHCGKRTALGALRNMPLTLNGAARFNIGNIAAAALAATALNIPPNIIAAELKRFGRTRRDNPGRLELRRLADITVVIDYAHNPDGLAMLLTASDSIRLDQARNRGIEGRVGLLLGQAGNRGDAAIDALARTAANFEPDAIVIKEITTMLRGRALGEVPVLLENGLIAAGYGADNIHTVSDEFAAACHLLRWAKAGDVLVLPIHQLAVRIELAALLDQLASDGWSAGSAVAIYNGKH